MSAISNLYIGDNELPLWIKDEEGEVSIYTANYLIPIFWMSLFCEKNLVAWHDQDADSLDSEENPVPTLIRVKAKCVSSFIDRKPLLESHISACSNHTDDFINEIIKSNGKYISLDMTELFYAVDDQNEFIEHIQNTLKMLDKNELKSLMPILKLADIQNYDNSKRDFIPPNEYNSRQYHLTGRITAKNR